ncbi:MAG: hypothetical protein LBR55_00705 [Bacteroidales bacterium]|jgi:DNA-binding FrmR family transcriptional regulator|nr:hypothetical protein [Bacteroidales bacterium]
MKTIIKQCNSNLFLRVTFLLILSLSACKVMLVPKYDEKIAEQIEAVSKSIDKLYLTMLETSSERTYSKFAEQYVNIEVELESILLKNKYRKKNSDTIEACESALELFKKYKEAHKKEKTIDDGTIIAYKESLKGRLEALLEIEKKKKIAE